MISPRNNFDLIRLVLAFIVFFFHVHVLSGRQEFAAFSVWLSADLAVKAFFVVSGFLVVMSCERSTSLGDYAWKRVRRIYPAYSVVIVICAIAGVAISTMPVRAYFSAAWLHYLVANLAFLNFLAPELPGVFQLNPSRVVNGALWSLKVEVMFYVAVPAIVWLCARGSRRGVLTTLYVLSVVWAVGMAAAAGESGRHVYSRLAVQLPGELRYFVAGAACYYARGVLTPQWRRLAAASLVVLLVPLPPAVNAVFEPAALGVVVIYLAVGAPYVGNVGRYGDLSYGIYITHFPVLQTLIAVGLFEAHPYLAFASAIGSVGGIALVSWHLIERPFLTSSSHYVRAERAPA